MVKFGKGVEFEMLFIVDADMIIFRACDEASVEVLRDDGTYTYEAQRDDILDRFRDLWSMIYKQAITYHKDKMDGEKPKIAWCLSDHNDNFRRAINMEYKSNRKGKKPLGYYDLEKWLIENTKNGNRTIRKNSLEADDCVGILATLPRNLTENCLIISGDKDMLTLPGWHYDYGRDEYQYLTEEEADRNFLIQTLSGDQTDGYKGCPGVGKVSAARLLDKGGVKWGVVVKAYIAAGLTADDALQQARMARILRFVDYDWEKECAKLWKPNM